MEFIKYHIAGKSYIFIPDEDNFEKLTKTDIINLCHNEKGAGADGIFTCNKNSLKIGHLRGFDKNGNIMRDFSSASICAVFEPFSFTHASEWSFLSDSEHKITVKTAFREDYRIFSCLIETPESEGIFREIRRKTEIGNRILTITPVNLHSICAVHFSECREKLDIRYLGQHISDNSLFRKEANLIIAEKTSPCSFDISFYENKSACPRPTLSAFAATALAACKNGICRYGEEIAVACGINIVTVICHCSEAVSVECTCQKVFLGLI